MAKRDFPERLDRRGFIRAGTAAAAVALAPVRSASAQPKNVSRNRTLTLVWAGRDGRWIDYELWNPYAIGSNHQNGPGILYEPLAFYSAFVDKDYLWLAESYEYCGDYKTLTIKTRPTSPGATASRSRPTTSPTPSTSSSRSAPRCKWGADVQQFLEAARATDENTVVVNFKVPAPRFFDFVAYKFDIGVYIMPKHIFEDQDWATFSLFDIAKGWPVTTGPWRVVFASPEQKVIDRAATGGGPRQASPPMPEIERSIYLPDPGRAGAGSGIIANQYDIATGIQPAAFATVFDGIARSSPDRARSRPSATSTGGRTPSTSTTRSQPWNDPNVRWALSYYLDRQQIIDIAWPGGICRLAPSVPDYPALQPFLEAVQDLIEEYPYLEFNPTKGDELLGKKGWTKDGDGMWLDGQGQPAQLEIISFFDFTAVGPVARRAAEAGRASRRPYAEPPNFFDRFSAGDYTGALFGHGGSYSSVYYSLRLYQTALDKIPGGHLVNFSRWHNDEYDKLVDELYGTSPTEKDKVMEIWTRRMEIWLPEYPDIQISQGLHRLPTNTTYWTNWPDAENPYVNTAHWHLTWPLVVHTLKPAVW